LGNATPFHHAHPIVRLALLLLELQELGGITEEEVENIYNGTDQFTRTTLQLVLKDALEIQTTELAENEAVDILSSVQ
jgi:hypothetical protein